MIGRLHHRDDFLALRRDGSTIRRGFLRVVYRPTGDPSARVRVAYAIGREVGTAVVRNRLRRRLRSVMTELSTQSDGFPSGDYLVRVSPTGANVRSSELKELLGSVVNELRLQSKKAC